MEMIDSVQLEGQNDLDDEMNVNLGEVEEPGKVFKELETGHEIYKKVLFLRIFVDIYIHISTP